MADKIRITSLAELSRELKPSQAITSAGNGCVKIVNLAPEKRIDDIQREHRQAWELWEAKTYG